MLYWAPHGTPADWCSGLVALQHSRVGEEPWFVAVNIALTCIVSVAIFGPLMVWLALRNEAALARSGIFLSVVAAFNLWITACMVTLRRSVVDPVYHQPTLPCVFQALLYVLVISLNGSVYLVRVLTLIYKARASRAALQLQRLG